MTGEAAARKVVDLRTTLLGGVVVALLSAGALWLAADGFDPSRLHLYGLRGRLNDQAGYVMTARILADTGSLGSGIILPAYADDPASRIYMPGYYVVLALSYATLGYGALPSLLPSLTAFVLATASLFAIAARRYGLLAGTVSVALFVAHAPNGVFAFTAMAELCFLAAGVLAFAVFLFLGPGARLVLAPVLVGIPFLFRETGALWSIPMVLLVFQEAPDRRWLRAAWAAAASVVLLYGLRAWQLASGKEALRSGWIQGTGFNYGDALAVDAPGPPLSELPALMISNAGRNAAWLGSALAEGPVGFESASLLFVLALLLAAAVVAAFAWAAGPRDLLPAAAVAMALATLVLGLAISDLRGYKLVRNSMFFVPLLCVAVGSGMARVDWSPRRALPGVLLLAALLWVSWTLPLAERASRAMVAGDRRADAQLAVMERVGHDDRTLLAAPWALGLEYALRAYPVRYAFPPANDASLRLLDELHPVGTLILPWRDRGRISKDALERLGLFPSMQIPSRGGGGFDVYQRVERPE